MGPVRLGGTVKVKGLAHEGVLQAAGKTYVVGCRPAIAPASGSTREPDLRWALFAVVVLVVVVARGVKEAGGVGEWWVRVGDKALLLWSVRKESSHF